ncbi:hypothetical protein [Burkholderia multivorans]|uniref:hypothetical protein n=1 Tax=Burkholderia multivorans TaxID=87883 RepID=UPI000CFED3DE|nr:hypothetical protein [Burkholderia multivorans]PRF91636.1 hypothetical protein C6Q23_09890 [Burkholderia multivorans]
MAEIDVKTARELAKRLRAPVAKFDNTAATYSEAADMIQLLCDRLEAAEKDAGRYRWLRGNAQPRYMIMAIINEGTTSLCRREVVTIDAFSWQALDQHLDAARAQRQGEGS